MCAYTDRTSRQSLGHLLVFVHVLYKKLVVEQLLYVDPVVGILLQTFV